MGIGYKRKNYMLNKYYDYFELTAIILKSTHGISYKHYSITQQSLQTTDLQIITFNFQHCWSLYSVVSITLDWISFYRDLSDRFKPQQKM